MPDLSQAAIRDWLDTHGSAAIDTALTADAPHDEHPEVLPSVLCFGAALDRAGDADPDATRTTLANPSHAARLATVLAHMGGGRRMRVIDWLNQAARPGSPRPLDRLLHADNGTAAAALRHWLLHLYRKDLLGRLFSRDRIDSLIAACQATRQPEHAP